MRGFNDGADGWTLSRIPYSVAATDASAAAAASGGAAASVCALLMPTAEENR